ncbi:MAG: sulfur carrier protein ThiS [Pseudodesulfovibrio sp.]
MIVVVNGKKTELRDGLTLLELLEAGDVPPNGVVAELNRKIVPGPDFADTVLRDGDHLEVLRFVGGG